MSLDVAEELMKRTVSRNQPQYTMQLFQLPLHYTYAEKGCKKIRRIPTTNAMQKIWNDPPTRNGETDVAYRQKRWENQDGKRQFHTIRSLNFQNIDLSPGAALRAMPQQNLLTQLYLEVLYVT